MGQTQITNYKSIRKIFFSLIASIVSLFAISIFLHFKFGVFNYGNFQAYFYLSVTSFFSIVAIIPGMYIYKNKMKDFDKLEQKDKPLAYFQALIIRSMITEGSGIFFIVGFLLYGKIIFLLGVIISITLLILFFPNEKVLNK